MDKFLFAKNETLSGFSSLLFGTFIYLIVSVLNKKINKFLSNETKLKLNINSTDNSDNKTLLTSLDVTNLQETNKSAVVVLEPNVVYKLTDNDNNSKQITKNNYLKKICLNATFFLVFIGTVSIWRGLWMLQLEFCYPEICESKVLNKNILNSIYFVFSILILWSLDLTSALLSRSSCEDSYFESKRNYHLKQNHFKTYFGTKKVIFIFYFKFFYHFLSFKYFSVFLRKNQTESLSFS